MALLQVHTQVFEFKLPLLQEIEQPHLQELERKTWPDWQPASVAVVYGHLQVVVPL